MEKRILKEIRLIDANQFEVVSWRAQGGREYANGFDDGVDYVVQKIDKAETVEAIPIEWLRSQMKNNPNDIESVYDDICLSELIEKWERSMSQNDD